MIEKVAERRADDVRELTWRLLVTTGTGALVGGVIGGIGGRLVMFVLRLGSSDAVIGSTTDDGFTIGIFTTSSLFLMAVTAGIGAATGVIYFIVRSALPRRGRAAIFSCSAGLYLGADVINPTTFDFQALDPKSFSVAAFILMPAIAALLIALIVERLLRVEAWSKRWLTILLGIGALPLVPVFPVVIVVFLVGLVLRRQPRVREPLLSVARVAVPVLVIALGLKSGVELWNDASALL